MRLDTTEDREKAAYLIAGLLAVPWLAARPPTAVLQKFGGVDLPQIEAAIAEAAQQAFLREYGIVQERLTRLVQDVIGGRLKPEQLYTAMEEVLKPAYERVSLYGKYAAGRIRDLSSADIREVTKQWDAEGSFAEKLVGDLAAGKVTDRRLEQRVKMYGDALREVFNRSWVHHKASPVFKWHMHPGAEHCVACIAAEGSSGLGLPGGFYRVGELPFYPGRSPVCLDNCMCWLTAADHDTGAPQIREPARGSEV